MDKQKLVVFGGAGYLGNYVVREAVESGKFSEIFVVTRNQSKAMLFEGLESVSVVKNVAKIEDEQVALVNLAYPLTKSFKAIKSQNLALFQQIEEVINRNDVTSFIHVSTIVLTLRGWSVENKIRKKNLYEYSKSLGEKKVYQIAKKTKVPTAIFRSGNILGPGSVWINKIGQAIIAGNVIFGRSEEYPSNATCVQNLAHTIVYWENPNPEGIKTYNHAEFAGVSWKTITRDVFKIEPDVVTTLGFESFSDVTISAKDEMRLLLRWTVAGGIKYFFKSQNFKGFVVRVKDAFFGKNTESEVKGTVAASVGGVEYADASQLSDLSVFSNTVMASHDALDGSVRHRGYNEMVGELEEWVSRSGYVET